MTGGRAVRAIVILFHHENDSIAIYSTYKNIAGGIPAKVKYTSRSYPKHELMEQGFVECRPSENPQEVIAAFWYFAQHHACEIPFHIEASNQHTEIAWPLQFHPEGVANCAGYVPREITGDPYHEL